MLRAVHAKSHGILKGNFEVLSGLPGPFAQGLFAKPSIQPVVMRFSTIPGSLLDDSMATAQVGQTKFCELTGNGLKDRSRIPTRIS